MASPEAPGQMLKNARRLVSAHPAVLEGFPLPSYPRMVEEMGERFVAHLQDAGRASARDVAWACDELLLSNDRNNLSTMQAAVCGCALLEAFAADPGLGRGSPSVYNAIEAIWPALRGMSPRGLAATRGLMRMLAGAVGFDDAERAAVRVADDLLTALGGGAPKLEEGQLAGALELWDEDLDWLLAAVAECEGVPAAVKARYRTCGARARARRSD